MKLMSVFSFLSVPIILLVTRPLWWTGMLLSALPVFVLCLAFHTYIGTSKTPTTHTVKSGGSSGGRGRAGSHEAQVPRVRSSVHLRTVPHTA